MALVKFPFMSIWCSGSMNKCITCKPLSNGRFCIGKYSKFNFVLKEPQKKWSEEFTRRALLMKLYLDNIDEAVEPETITDIIP